MVRAYHRLTKGLPLYAEALFSHRNEYARGFWTKGRKGEPLARTWARRLTRRYGEPTFAAIARYLWPSLFPGTSKKAVRIPLACLRPYTTKAMQAGVALLWRWHKALKEGTLLWHPVHFAVRFRIISQRYEQWRSYLCTIVIFGQRLWPKVAAAVSPGWKVLHGNGIDQDIPLLPEWGLCRPGCPSYGEAIREAWKRSPRNIRKAKWRPRFLQI